LPVVAERALESAACVGHRFWPAINHAERTGNDTVTAAVTNIVLHEDGPDLGAHNRTSGTSFQAAGFFAVFANVGEKNPAKRIFSVATAREMGTDDLTSFLPILFQKQNMPPCRCTKPSRIVVRISRPNETVVRHLVPFLARDFASFAANANGWVSEEADLYFFLYKIVMALVGAFCAFADHGLCAHFAVVLGAYALRVPFAAPSPAKILAHSFPSVA
jgi:hypothetical protein